MNYKVEVWKRIGPWVPPNMKERRELMTTLEVEATTGLGAVHAAAKKYKLALSQWGNSARPEYIMRVVSASKE